MHYHWAINSGHVYILCALTQLRLYPTLTLGLPNKLMSLVKTSPLIRKTHFHGYPYGEGLGLPNNPDSRRIPVHTIFVEDVSLNILIIEGFLKIFLIISLACFIHSSHEIINIVTLTIWHDCGHSKINSTSQNGID